MTKKAQNIILSFSTEVLSEDVNVHYFLSYLKLRILSKNYGGNLPSLSKIAKHLNLTERKSLIHINKMLKLNWVRKYNGHYQLVSMYDICASKESGRKVELFKLTDSMLMKFTWKNISLFKAVLAEIAFEHKCHAIDAVHKKLVKEKLTKESHGYAKLSKGQMASYKKATGELEDRYFSCSYGAIIVNKSQSTIHHYRSVLKERNYKSIGKYSVEPITNFKRFTRNISGEFIQAYTEKQNIELDAKFSKSISDIRNPKKNKHGFYFKSGATINFSETTKRKETHFLHKSNNYCKKYIQKRNEKIQMEIDYLTNVSIFDDFEIDSKILPF